jgi:small-conductance mechanosensitive channel
VLGGGVALGASPFGGRLARALPLWTLIAVQGFRLPLELVMHRAATEGTMPIAMSYSGYNFDIVTGASALLLAWAARRGRAPAALVLAWNILGSCLLAVIAIVAFLASPMVQAFGPDQVNRWVTYFPFVYLPAVLVLAAVAGHLVIFRRLALEHAARTHHA